MIISQLLKTSCDNGSLITTVYLVYCTCCRSRFRQIQRVSRNSKLTVVVVVIYLSAGTQKIHEQITEVNILLC